MTQENEVGNDKPAEEEVPEEIEIEEGQEDSADFWKAQALKNHGIAKRYKTRLDKVKVIPEEKPIAEKKEVMPEKKSDELNYGELAFYNSKSDSVKIESDEEIEHLKKTIADTGKTQSAILNSKWFQSELKEMRELKQTQDAMPGKGKRSNNSARDSVEYWIAKGELPEDIELKRKVVAAISKSSSSKNPFSIK